MASLNSMQRGKNRSISSVPKKQTSGTSSRNMRDFVPQSKNKPSLQQDASKKYFFFYCILIFVFSFGLYANTLNFGYVLDDDVVYRQNQFVQKGFNGIKDIVTHGFLYGFNKMNNQSYRPLTSIDLAIEKQLFGNNPKANHFFHVLLYAVSCALLFVLLRRFFAGFHVSIPLAITLIFASHPIHTEVVANITSRTEILGLFFSLLSLIFLFRHIDRNSGIAHTGNRFLILSASFFFCALLSKESTLTIALVIPFALYFFSVMPVRKIFLLCLPYFAAAAIYLVIRNAVLDSVAFGEKLDIINNGLVAAKNQSEMLATGFVILAKYVQLLFFPHPLSWDYSYSQFPVVGWTSVKAIFSFLLYAGLGAVALTGIKKKNPVSFGILFYLITLSVTSNLVIKIGATLGERFMYTPSIGFSVCFVFVLWKIYRLLKHAAGPVEHANIFGQTPVLLILLAVIFLFSFKTVRRNNDWENNFALFSAGIDACPNSSRVHYAIGYEYRVRGEQEPDVVKRKEWFDKAVASYKKSVEIYPEFTAGWYNLGVTWYSAGDHENALQVYLQTLKLDSNYYQALNNAGVIYFNRKDFKTALNYFLKAMKISPDYADPYANIGAVYHNLGDYPNALKYYKEALRLDPKNRNVLGNMEKLNNVMK